MPGEVSRSYIDYQNDLPIGFEELCDQSSAFVVQIKEPNEIGNPTVDPAYAGK